MPEPREDARAFAEAVENVVDRELADILLPMTDTSAVLLLTLRARRPVRIPFPSVTAYEAISDKAELTRVASGLGIPVPKQLVVTAADRADADTIARQVTEDQVKQMAEFKYDDNTVSLGQRNDRNSGGSNADHGAMNKGDMKNDAAHGTANSLDSTQPRNPQ